MILVLKNDFSELYFLTASTANVLINKGYIIAQIQIVFVHIDNIHLIYIHLYRTSKKI